MAPIDFSKGQKIDVKAIKMTSSHTQLPFEYFSLPFCPPPKGIECKYIHIICILLTIVTYLTSKITLQFFLIDKTENLGEILRGDRISSTRYHVEMDKSTECQVLCEKPAVFEIEHSNMAHYRIEQEYFM